MSQMQSTFHQGAGFEPLIDLEAAADLLRLHPDTLKKKARAGQIPGHKTGRRWWFRMSELDAWVKSTVTSRQPQSRRVT